MMGQAAMDFFGDCSELSGHLGLRVARWLKARSVKPADLVQRAGLDKRSAASVLEGHCGPRAWDALSAAFGWDMIEAVMAPVVGADPIAAREAELEARLAAAAALHARLERERTARAGVGSLRPVVQLVAGTDSVSPAPLGGGA
jgi:hypothetical protein